MENGTTNGKELLELRRQLLEAMVKKDSLLTESKEYEQKAKALETEKSAKTAPLWEQINAVSKPYSAPIEEASKKHYALADEAHKMSPAIEMLEARIKNAELGSMTQFPNAESFKAFLLAHGVDKIEKLDEVGKKVGTVKLFRHFDDYADGASESSWVSYFATYGKNIVGFLNCRKSEHAGDQSEYHAWIGVKKFKSGNQVKAMYKERWGKRMEEDTMKFREWKAALEATDGSKLEAVDMTDKDNIKVLGTQSYMNSLPYERSV